MSKYFNINYFGEWLQNVAVGLLTGLISGIFVALLFILPSNPSVEPYLFFFIGLIFVFLFSNIIVQLYREKINRNKGSTQLDSKNSLVNSQTNTISHYWEL